MIGETTKPVGFSADAKVMHDAIARVAKAASNRSVQVLGGIRIESDGEGGNAICIAATDMNLTLRERIPVDGLVPDGECVVLEAAKVLKGLATLDGQLAFSTDGEHFAVKNGTTKLRFPLGEIADYPKLPFGNERTVELAVDRAALLAAFERVGKAASKDQSRPVLCGVRIEPDTETDALRIIATDSYRLAADTVPHGGGEFVGMTVPAADLKTVLALAKKGDGPLFLSQEIEPVPRGGGAVETVAMRLYVRDFERMACLRRIDGQFPNWRQLVTAGFESSAVLDREKFGKALARMAKLASRNAPVRLEVAGSQFRTSYSEQDSLEVETILDAEIEGDWPSSALGANPEFLFEAVSAIDSERVRVHAINPLRPILVTAEEWPLQGEGWAPAFHLVMPIRLAG